MSVENLRGGLHVSVSQVKSFVLCPRMYELRYVRGVEPAFIPLALAFGSAFHQSLATFYGFIRETGAAPSVEELVAVFRDAWDNASDGPVPLQAEDEDRGIDPVDKGAGMLAVFHAHAVQAPLPDVVEVEKGWAIDVYEPDSGSMLEEKLVGAFDLVTREGGRNVITEHKSAARKYSADQLAYDIQMSAYYLAAHQLGLGAVGLRYQVVTKTKVPAVQIAEVTRGAQDVDDFMRTVVGVLRAIDAGAFWPNRGWQCKGCQFAHACVGSTGR